MNSPKTLPIPFDQLGLRPELLKVLKTKGYSGATPIQVKTIPYILKGRDIIARAQTGTGKTEAFALPLVDILSRQKTQGRYPRALVLTPTRELALQVGEVIKAYARIFSMRCTVVHGGVRIDPQIDRLKRGVDVLVATPGRLLDLAGYRHLNLSRVGFLIFDEADRMLDLGFNEEISQILDLVPTERSSMLLSATYTSQIRKLAGRMLQRPKYIEISPGKTAAELVAQKVCLVDRLNKRELLIHLINRHSWPRILVFCRTKHGADKLTQKLTAQGIHAAVLHGNKSQPSRSRILDDFKKGLFHILVATDVAARGLDIIDLPVVINYNIPHIPEDYVHRIGRTGRAGLSGVAISLVSHDEKPYLSEIEKLLKQKIPVEKVDGFTVDSDVPDFVLFRPNSTSSERKADPSIKEMVAKRNASKSQKKARKKARKAASTKVVKPKSRPKPDRQKDKERKRSSRAVSHSPLSSNSSKTRGKRKGK